MTEEKSFKFKGKPTYKDGDETKPINVGDKITIDNVNYKVKSITRDDVYNIIVEVNKKNNKKKKVLKNETKM